MTIKINTDDLHTTKLAFTTWGLTHHISTNGPNTTITIQTKTTKREIKTCLKGIGITTK